MFGEGVSGASCIASRRLRGEVNGREYAVGDSPDLPEALSEAKENGRLVLDYRFTARDSGLANFPVAQRSEGTEAAERERAVLFGGTPTPVRVVDASGFKPGMSGVGPCVIESSYWSAVLPAGWHWRETDLGVQISR